MTLFWWFPLLFLGVVTSRTELIANKKLNHHFKVRVQVLYATSCLWVAWKFAGNSLLTTIAGNVAWKLPKIVVAVCNRGPLLRMHSIVDIGNVRAKSPLSSLFCEQENFIHLSSRFLSIKLISQIAMAVFSKLIGSINKHGKTKKPQTTSQSCKVCSLNLNGLKIKGKVH